MKKIVLAGGSGNLGSLLIRTFRKRYPGVALFILSRNAPATLKGGVDGLHKVLWDGKTLGAWQQHLEGADVVLNLSGKSIQCRFTDANKRVLKSSRLAPTSVLGEAIATLQQPPRLWINFSGISIFNGMEQVQNEDSTSYGSDFLAQLTQQWEQAFWLSNTPNTHKVALRVSPVLSAHSGMFSELLPLVRWGLGGKVGSGRQLVSWIHEHDLAALVCWIMEKEYTGSVYHACSPHPVTNSEFMHAFREAVGCRMGLPLPTPLAHVGAFFKGVDSSVLLQTVPVRAKTSLQEGFSFKFPYIHDALNQLLTST